MERQGGGVDLKVEKSCSISSHCNLPKRGTDKWDGVSFNPAAIVCVFWFVNPPKPLGQTSVIFVTMTDGEDGR